jgi:hypothetical protein
VERHPHRLRGGSSPTARRKLPPQIELHNRASSELDLLEARAQFDATERAVDVRLAEYDGRIYLDLCDEHWRAIEIGRDGWRLEQISPCALSPACRYAFATEPSAWGDRSKRSVRSSTSPAKMISS